MPEKKKKKKRKAQSQPTTPLSYTPMDVSHGINMDALKQALPYISESILKSKLVEKSVFKSDVNNNNNNTILNCDDVTSSGYAKVRVGWDQVPGFESPLCVFPEACSSDSVENKENTVQVDVIGETLGN